MKGKSRFLKVTGVFLSTFLLFSCSHNSESDIAESENITTTEDISKAISEMVNYNDEDYYTDWKEENPVYIQLNGTDASFDETSSIIASEGMLTIKTSGVYVICGTWDDGQIVVDVEDKGTVRLVLNGVKINCTDNAPLYVKNADNTVISLPKGTENILSDGSEYVLDSSSEDEPNSAIFSKDNLTINGAGSLIVNGNYNDGITSKDDLKIMGGKIQVKAVDDGLIGRDLVAVKDGKITIEAGGDGIKSTNDTEDLKGEIAIEGGSFDIKAGGDGIQAITSLWISDGSYTISSGGGSPETVKTNDEMMRGPGGAWGKQTMPSTAMEDSNTTTEAEDSTDKQSTKEDAETTVLEDTGNADDSEKTTTEETETPSTKGIKATSKMVIGGGSFKIDSSDDAVHSNDSVTIVAGDFDIASGDDGIHADSSILTTGGDITITKSNEGIESQKIKVLDGNIHITAGDDGINVGGGNDGSGMGMQMDIPAGDEGNIDDTETNAKSDIEDEEQSGTDDMSLTIKGGYISIDAGGDGLDSNGSISMTDGTVIVNGPTNNGNGSLDYNDGFEMSGGLLIAAGSSGMVMSVSDDSTQYSMMMTYSETQKAGTIVHLEDSKGNTIATFAPSKDFQSVVICSPDLEKDASYILYSGGTSTGKEIDGLYSDGGYKKGTKMVEFTISDSVTYLDESGVTTNKSMSPGGQMSDGGQKQMPEGFDPSQMPQRGERPDGGQMSEDAQTQESE